MHWLLVFALIMIAFSQTMTFGGVASNSSSPTYGYKPRFTDLEIWCISRKRYGDIYNHGKINHGNTIMADIQSWQDQSNPTRSSSRTVNI